ncbi:MAG: Amuc_1099 family pilus-like system protein [Prosthecobacter sp.]
MQKSQGSYEKVILTISALLTIGVAVYLVLLSRGFEESLAVTQAGVRNNLNPPNTPAMAEAIDTIKKKYAWLSPVRNGKPVPLNKSVLLVMKQGELFDLTLPEPLFRAPMTNVFVVGDKTKSPPEDQLPNLFSPNLAELDADDDGFTNLEEFNGKTDPRDPQKMPPLTDKLFLKQRISHDYIVKLVSGDGTTFQVQRLKPEPRMSKFVAINQGFGFEKGSERFKATSVEKKTIDHPTLGKKDVYVLKITDLSTNKEFEAVEGLDVNLADYEAEFEFRWKKRSTIPGVREGKTFQLPGLGKSFYILKLEETKAVIAPLIDGKPASETIEIKQG